MWFQRHRCHSFAWTELNISLPWSVSSDVSQNAPFSQQPCWHSVWQSLLSEPTCIHLFDLFEYHWDHLCWPDGVSLAWNHAGPRPSSSGFSTCLIISDRPPRQLIQQLEGIAARSVRAVSGELICELADLTAFAPVNDLSHLRWRLALWRRVLFTDEFWFTLDWAACLARKIGAETNVLHLFLESKKQKKLI